MVLGHDIGPMPLTAIWALHLEGQENQNTPWRAVVAHWKKIDYEGEKRKNPPHPEPDYMGDILDPRSAHQFPKNIIPNATVEGRLLETILQEKPFHQQSPTTGDRLTFMIDVEAKDGDIPKYREGQKAQLCGFASHIPPSGKGGEMIKRIFRDDFCLWGHIHNQQQNQKWKILPMYFIPHGGGIMNLTNVIEYKLPQQPAKIQKRMMAAPAPELQPVSLEKGNDPPPELQPVSLEQGNNPPPANQAADTKGAEDNTPLTRGADLDFSTANEEPEEKEEVANEQQFFKKPLKEEDFGEEAAAADAEAASNENDW